MLTVKNISRQMVILNMKKGEATYFAPRKKDGSSKPVDETNVIKSEFDYYVKNGILKIENNVEPKKIKPKKITESDNS